VGLERHARYPKAMCGAPAVRAQVERTPEATALVFGDQALSYAELNAGPTAWRTA
jgi:non-ribosomal peptide synthetase component F